MSEYEQAIEILQNNIEPDGSIDFYKLYFTVDGEIGNAIIEICYNSEINIDMLDGLLEIPDYYFDGAQWLPAIIKIPDSVKTIGKRAFAESNIKEIYLTKNIHKIKSEAFSNCQNLVHVYNAEPDINYGLYAFFGCNKLDMSELNRNFANPVEIDKLTWSDISTMDLYDQNKIIKLQELKFNVGDNDIGDKLSNKIKELFLDHYAELNKQLKQRYNAQIEENTNGYEPQGVINTKKYGPITIAAPIYNGNSRTGVGRIYGYGHAITSAGVNTNISDILYLIDRTIA